MYLPRQDQSASVDAAKPAHLPIHKRPNIGLSSIEAACANLAINDSARKPRQKVGWWRVRVAGAQAEGEAGVGPL